MLLLASEEGQCLMSQLPELHCMALQMCLSIFPFYLYLTERASLVGSTVKAGRDSLSKSSLYESM